MKSLRKTILLTVSLLSVASPAFAKDEEDEDRSQTSTSQPSSERQDSTTTRPPRQEERREDSTTTRPPRQEERREDTITTRPPNSTVTGSSTTRPPRPEERREDTTTTRPPRSTGTGPSTTRPPAPSSTGTTGREDSNRPESDKDLREVLVKIANSSLDATLKASLTQQVQTVINAIAAGTATPADMERTLKAVKDALKGKEGRQGETPTSRGDDDEDGADDGDYAEDGEDALPSGGSTPPRDSGTRPPRDAAQSRSDLKEKLTEVVEKLSMMTPSAEKDAATASVNALLALLETDQAVTPEQVRQVLDQVRAIASSRLGLGERSRSSDEPYEAPEQHEQSRIAGAVAEALRQLTGIETPEAASARTALEAIQSQIASNSEVNHDAFKSAMDQARAALSSKPGARAAMTLAGVIKRLEDARESTPEREEMINLIRDALEQARLNPDADPNELVKAALEQARELRIAAARVKLLAIAERLTSEATAAGNNDLLVILSSVTAELNSPDGTLPTREQLHRMRDTLEDVESVLHPESEDESDTTLPEEESSTTTPQDTQPDSLDSGVREPAGTDAP